MKLENETILPDGRRLAYAEYGKPDGEPVLYFHGTPSSRLELLIVGDDRLAQLGLRVIAADRPGMGGSDFQPGRGFSSWPTDVIALANTLALERFSVLGMSGGGAYVAVCAAKIPARLRAAVIVSGGWQTDWQEAKTGMPFMNRLVWTLADRAPFLLRLLLGMSEVMPQGERDRELARLKKQFPPPDIAVLEQPGRLEAFARNRRESQRQGTKGQVWDMRLFVREFDFRLDEVRMPLTLFHGQQDRNVPIGTVRKVVAGLPTARLVTYDNEAHLSTLCNHMEEIASELVGRPRGAGPA